MFRRARLSVKPNVRPSVGARASAASASQRGPDTPRPPAPAAPAAPAAPQPAEPAEPADAAPVDLGGAQLREKAPRSGSDEKTDGGNDAEESSRSSSVVPQRRKRVSSTSSLAKPDVSVPSEPQPSSAVSPEAPAPSPGPAAEKQPCSDRYRLYKAQKLREMLKEELRKEKKQWKNKYATSESQRPPDRSRMTMRDFIYYLPDNNPMTSSLEQEKRAEKPPTPVPTREQENKIPPDTEDNEDIDEEADDGPLLVPRVKVAEDGSIILDEESLTVEVLRTKGPCVVEENDPIFERGSTTTYSSFRKNYYSKPWSNKETDMFFLAISMVGTDFSMIGQLFPHRARIEIKNKFKREEKTNGWRIDKAFQEKRPFDFDFFAHLLQKVLAEEEKRKQKSVKSQPLKEKKSSKPQKNVKVKKVACEGVSEDPEESVSAQVSDSEGSQKEAVTVEEPSPASEQDLEQVESESDLNQNKRRKRNQDEVGQEAVQNDFENIAAQPEPLEGAKQHDKCGSLRSEIDEDDGSKEQVLPCTQNSGDIGFSSEEVEERTDAVLPSSGQQDVMAVADETVESRTSESPPPDGDGAAACARSLAEGGSAEDRAADAGSQTPEADQVGRVKPRLRGRLQRPKPNLSRALGKKPVPPQSKPLTESKSLGPEASAEKSNMEKDEVNTVDIPAMENTDGKKPDAETLPNSSEKACLQDDDRPKVLRPARLVRGRLQRPKPNLGKAAGRKETPPSQDENGAHAEKRGVQSCAGGRTSDQVEDQSYKNFESEDIMSQPEKKDDSQKMQLDDPAVPEEGLSSIQEDSTSNVLKQVPVLKTRFQKPKPNVGRGNRKRGLSSKEDVAEEILASEKMTAALRESARLEISPGQEVSVETATTQEMNSCLKESGGGRLSPTGKIAETVDASEEMETDLKETGMEIPSSQTVAEVTEVLEEQESGFREARVEISPREAVGEVTEIIEERESDLKETGAETSPSKMIPEVTDVLEEKESDLQATGEEIPSCQRMAEVIETTDEETREEITLCQRIAEVIEISENKESNLRESGEEVTLCHRIAEVIGITEGSETEVKETGEEMREITEEKESDLKEIKEISPFQRIEMIEIPEENELDLKETGETVTPWQRIEMVEVTEGKESDLEETGNEVAPCQGIAEMIEITEERETDVKEIEEITPCHRIAEDMEVTEERETDVKEIKEEITPCQRIAEGIEVTEERETDVKEIEEISPCHRIAEDMEITKERESDVKEIQEITPCQRIAEGIEVTEERETNLEEVRRKGESQKEKVPDEVNTLAEVETDLRGTGKEISLREKAQLGVSAIGEREVSVKETGKGDMSALENIPGKVAATEERKAGLKETQGDVSLLGSRSEDVDAAEEMVADCQTVRPEDVSLTGSETAETGTFRQTEPDPTPASCGACSARPLKASNVSSELLPRVQTPAEETSSEMGIASPARSLQTVGCDKLEDEGMPSAAPPERCSDASLSHLLAEEQKPAGVKPAPFVRSRFKRPKPNLARAALKRETAAAKTPVPGKTMEPARAEGAEPPRSAGHVSTVHPQPDVAPVTTTRERDESCPGAEGAGALPREHSEHGLLPTSALGSREEVESAPTQEEDVAVSVGARSTNTSQQVTPCRTSQSTVPVRGRLHRPRPNVQRAGQRRGAAGVEAEAGTLQEGPSTVQREEAGKKVPETANSHLGSEIEVVSSKISECRVDDVLEEQESQEHKAHVPSPAPLVRRQFQKVKPNLGRPHGRREELCPGTGRAGRSQANEPEIWLQQGGSHTQLPAKERSELQTSHEISTRIDCAVKPALTSKGAQSEVRPSANVKEKAVGDHFTSSMIKEQHFSKPPSCPQLLKESGHSKSALDRRTASAAASEREADPGGRRAHRRSKSSAPRARGSKRGRSRAPKKEPRTSKATLVTLRASQEEEDDDVDDFELDYEEESCHLAPEEVNKAPVFVPIGLRSPEPVAAQIEETMEELEITVNVPDVGCIAVVEHELANMDVNPQEMRHDVSENMLTVEVTTSEHTQNEAGTSDGNSEAAIALLTMGDLVLQSEVSTEEGEVGICVLPDVQSRDKNHIPFSPDHVSPSIVHECQDLPSPVTTAALPPWQETQIALEGQSATETVELLEKAKEETLPHRNTASEVTSHLRKRSRFAKPKVNLKKILGTNRVGAHRGVPNVSGTKGEEEIHRETEKDTSDAAELEETLGAATAAESQEPSGSQCVCGVQGPSDPQLEDLPKRSEEEEAGTQQAQMLSLAPVVLTYPNPSPHTLSSSEAPGESPMDVPPGQASEGTGELTLHLPECVSAGAPGTRENVIGSQELAVSVVGAEAPQEDEDEHTFILTLVEIPTDGAGELAGSTVQSGLSPVLPAPILVKSANAEGTGHLSLSFPLTPIRQDATGLPDSRREPQEPPANLNVSRKRFRCSPDDSDRVPPAKRSSLASVDNCEKCCSSEVCSKELVNIFEEAGASPEAQGSAPTSGSGPTTPESRDRQCEPSALQSKVSRSLDKRTPHAPQEKMVLSDKEERTRSTSKSEHTENRPSTSKASLTRPGRRPLGFLSLICSKSSLESDEPTQFHKKKRPKPLIPASRQNLKRSNPSSESHKTSPEPSHALPSPSGDGTGSETLSSSAAAAQVSCDDPLLEEKSKSGPNPAAGEEPTTVSELFFGDIFIEVDEKE